MCPVFVRVSEFRRDTHDVFTLGLEPPSDRAWSFQPGQFNMVYAFGVGEVPISMSGDPADRTMICHTIRACGSVTNALERLQPGATVGVRGPFGSSWPLERARGGDVVIVSGGIGLAPLRSAIYHLLQHRADYGRVVLLHGARTPADLVYRDELEAWSRRPDFEVLVTIDRADASWRGPIGTATMLFPQARFDPQRTIGLMCGPEVMMRFTLYEFAKRGVPEDRLYVSMERNMQCALGQCGHCQFGPSFVCLDGPVFRLDHIRRFWEVREA
jgi:NAD(P)H-flavin reductase